MEGKHLVAAEVERQMSEEGRKQWLSGHVSRGKAYESLEQAFAWLLAKRKEAKILSREAWAEPFAPDRRAILTAAEAIGLLLRIIRLNRDQKELGLGISEDEIKHELRGDIRELLIEVDRLFEKRSFFEEHAGSVEREAEEEALGGRRSEKRDVNGDLAKREKDFDRRYREKLRDLVERSCFPGAPYRCREALDKANYTGTVVSLLKMLVEVVRWNEFNEGDKDVILLIENTLSRCWSHIASTSRSCPGGGVGWGWAALTKVDGVAESEREEIGAIYDLDADVCAPQTCYTSQVISVLTRLYLLMDEATPVNPVFRARVERVVDKGEVRQILEAAIEGLVSTNRVGDGWIDVEPYQPTTGLHRPEQAISPIGYNIDNPEASLLHTSYAVAALAELAVLAEGVLKLTEKAQEALHKGVFLLLKELDRPSLSFMKQPLLYTNILSRTIDGKELVFHDECGVYLVFKAVALYSRLVDPEGPVSGYEALPRLSDHDNKPYYALARFILEEIREPMYDKRGFPAIGEFGKGEVDKFPAIRATAVAIAAFQYFGLIQMVPSISRILQRHLDLALEDIILELVAKYGDLEQRGIRVAWGLIEADGEAILKKRRREGQQQKSGEEKDRAPGPRRGDPIARSALDSWDATQDADSPGGQEKD